MYEYSVNFMIIRKEVENCMSKSCKMALMSNKKTETSIKSIE